MPHISEFYGIKIKMFFEGEEPHFYARYNDYIGRFDVKTLQMTEGDIPYRSLCMIKEWAEQHQKELSEIFYSIKWRALPPLE